MNTVTVPLRVKVPIGLALIMSFTACPQPDGSGEGAGDQEAGPDQAFLSPDSVAALYERYFLTFLTSPCSTAPVNNEVHDCQRLIQGTGGSASFGPLVGIMPNLTVVNQGAEYFQTPRVAAWIVNAGPTSGTGNGYPPLGIQPGTQADPSKHCLWLRQSSGSWDAAIEYNTDPGKECGEPPTDWSNLAVERQTYGNLSLGGYPNTARWQWTDTGSIPNGATHFVGIKCGNAWCAVGEDGFSAPMLPTPDQQPDPTRAIPGFFDAQFLGVQTGPTLRPGPWGTVYPVAVPSNWDGTVPLSVAEFWVDPGRGLGQYTQKLGLPAAGAGNRWSHVMLWATGLPGSPAAARYKDSPVDVGHPANVIADPVNAHGPANAARWQWKDTDETVWVPCPWGCCEVQEGAPSGPP